VKLYGAWRVTLPDESYLFEPDEMLGSEWSLIETELGMSFEQWVSEINEARFVACQGLVWFLRRKAGRLEDRMAVDFKIRQLVLAREPDPKELEHTEQLEIPGSAPLPAATGSVRVTGKT
jgi:hypothetical protein